LYLRSIGAAAWLRLVRSLNGIAAVFFGAILLLNAAYPQAITQLGDDLPSWAKIAGGVVWFMLIDYALKRAKS
jgi:hypothetical protein